MSNLAWTVAAVVGAAGVLWITKYAIAAIAAQVVAQIGDSLQARWQEDISAAVEPLAEQVEAIHDEVTYNAGKSLKDMVRQINQQVESILTDR